MSLVVTIIVLLILSGVTIVNVINDDGIISKAEIAASLAKKDQILTSIQLDILAEEMDGTSITLSKMDEILSQYGTVQYDDDGNITGVLPDDLDEVIDIAEIYTGDLNDSSNSDDGDTEEETLVADGSFSETKGVNTPYLGDGMTAITWNGSNWVKTTNEDEWYSYTTTDKKWANAVLNGTFNDDGTLDESATGYSMFVWIPRYAYQIEDNYHNGGSGVSGTINIKFMKGTTNTAADGTTSWDNSTGEGNWNIHPAFEYSSTVAGIWVAKFEASSVEGNSDTEEGDNVTTKTLQVKAGVSSWRYITIGNIYTVCLNYNTTLNSHLMKNSEWGAVAYLAQSTYGKNSEVWINPNSSYITGQAGTSVSASSTTSTYAYTNTTYGVNASTTGNVYGIYDMSGGNWEYVAAYVDSAYTTTYGASLISGASYAKDVYSVSTVDEGQSFNYLANVNVYGDAIYETSSQGGASGAYSWSGDDSRFPSNEDPFFLRGGYNQAPVISGIFAFYFADGRASEPYGFRPVLAVL